MKMSKRPYNNEASLMIGNNGLVKLKLKSIRSGVWFKTLNKIERALVNLTIKVVHHVRSITLAKILFSITAKLKNALESKVLHAIKEVGFPLAQKLSLLAQKWNNDSARNWMYDLSFAKFFQTDIASINGKLLALDGELATIQTNVGTFTTSLADINTKITVINGNIARIDTDVGTIKGLVTKIDGDNAVIMTDIGEMHGTISDIKGDTGLQPATIGLSILAAISAIAAAVMILRKVYLK